MPPEDEKPDERPNDAPLPDPSPEPEPKEPEGGDDGGDEGSDPHPLEPGGKRFNQVVARSKKAETRARELEAELQRERENRIRLEEREKLRTQEPAKPAAKILTWADLDPMIEEGKITRAQANEYRERVIREEARRESAQTVETVLSTREREQRVLGDLDRYTKFRPGIMDESHEDRRKVKAQFTELVRDYGYPSNHATELVATKMVFGSLAALERQAAANDSATQNREAFVETHGQGGRRPKDEGKDPVKGLDERQRSHYAHLINRGIYRDWEAVREELTWKRGRKKAS